MLLDGDNATQEVVAACQNKRRSHKPWILRPLGRAHRNADAVREDLQHYGVEPLGMTDGVLVVNETGFL